LIKARGKSGKGEEFVLLGLSWENLDRLRKGEPIRFDGRPYGIPMDVLIVSGRTERDIAESLIQVGTVVHVEK
jgi:hypothetical protein